MVNYNAWKKALAQLLIKECGMKKKCAKKASEDYEDEFLQGVSPEDVVASFQAGA